MALKNKRKKDDLRPTKSLIATSDNEHVNIDVRAARLKLGMTQPAFSECFGVALPTLRKWEQGVRRPDQSARVLLRVIEVEPDAVKRALGNHEG